jgi:hypothetical protein
VYRTNPVHRRSPRSSPFGTLVAFAFIIALAGGATVGAGIVLQTVDLRTALDLPALTPSPGPDLPGGLTGDRTPRPAATGRSGPSATPKPRRTPRPTPRLDPPPRRGPFTMDLYREGDFVTEKEDIWCVAAAMQTMENIVRKGRNDDSYETQQRLYKLAHRHSTDRLVGVGAEPEGWATGLNLRGVGPYIVYIAASRRGAIRAAARAIRLTGRPAGLVTWRGAHSWVMSGFKATADPAWTSEYTVTHVFIEDVWYPRVSSIWGASRPPDARVDVADLPEDFLAFHRYDQTYPDRDGLFVVILPVRRAPADLVQGGR